MPRLVHSTVIALLAMSLGGCFKEQPKDISGYLERAREFSAQGDTVKARAELQNALRLAPADPKLNFALGQNADASGDVQAAFAFYVRAAAPDAHLREAQIRTIEILLNAGRAQDALGRANLTLGSFPNDAEALALRADAETSLEQLTQARNDALAVVQKSPTNARALAVLARLDLHDKNPQAALGRLAPGLAAHSKDIQLLQVQAAAQMMANRLDEASSTWGTVVGLAPRDVFARSALAALQTQLGRSDQAIAGFRKAAAADGNNQEMQLAFARFLSQVGKPDEAESFLKGLISNNPKEGIYDLALADLYQSRKQLEMAAGVLTKAQERLGGTDQSRTMSVNLAKAQAQMGRLDLAYRNLDKVFKGDPSNREALMLRAELNRSEGRTDGAISDLLTILRMDPVNARAYSQLATLYLGQGKTKLAVDAMRRAASASANDDDVQIRLARFLQRAGDPKGARDIMQQLTTSHPGSQEVWDASGQLAIQRQDWGVAAVAVARLNDLPGGVRRSARLNGEIQAAKGDNAGAILIFESLIDRDRPRLDPELLGLLVTSGTKAGQSGEVAQYLSEKTPTFDAEGQAIAWPAILASAAEAGDFTQALDAFRQAKSLTPANIDIYNAAARIMVAQGHVDEARRSLEDGIAAGAPKWALMMTMGDMDAAAGSARVALADYKAASDDAPANIYASNNYGSMLSDLEPRDIAALTAARNRLNGQEETNNPALADTIAWLDYRLGRFDEAKAILARVDAGKSPSPKRRFHYAAVLLATGDKTAGNALLDSLKGVAFPGSGEIATLPPS